jgi:hypothetical protein
MFATLNAFDVITALLLGFIYYGGAILLAVLCAYFALRRTNIRGVGKLVLWTIAVMLLLVQGGCWMLATGLQKALH